MSDREGPVTGITGTSEAARTSGDTTAVNGTAAAVPEKLAATEGVDEFGLPIKKPRRSFIEEERDTGKNKENGRGKQDEAREPGRVAEAAGESKVRATPAEERSGQAAPAEGSTNEHQGGDTNDEQPGGNRPNEPRTSTTSQRRQSEAFSPTSERRLTLPRSSQEGAAPAVSEWSHQQLAPPIQKEEKIDEEEQWQTMPAFAPFDLYNDDGKLIAKEAGESDDEEVMQYGTLGGAGKGYTRVQVDEDAQSATSMDENTAYLFKERSTTLVDDDDDVRDQLSQMQATKELLTEGQRIAYVGLTRLAMAQMTKELESMERTKATKKSIDTARDAMKKWAQKMIVRMYSHMEIDSAEQVMIEQLAEHGVEPGDMSPALMKNAHVKNPAAETDSGRPSMSSPRPSSTKVSPSPSTPDLNDGSEPPPYSPTDGVPGLQSASELRKTKTLDIDLRWTVLCDLFLVLISDSVYDARSRQLMERVGSFLDVSWLEICQFEKRVTDALEMQESSNKENWNEEDHIEDRRKRAQRRRLAMMGLATVGGGLVIGLSAGLLAPLIGAGLAAGFTTIGVAGTSGFLAGAGGAAVITTTGIVTGSTMGIKATNRRTGAVKTFEYRPLHNNKRVNLIVSVSGWMNGKVDDVRLPYSTVDPIMGDIYSVHWEPEMLQSMGQTINILATEALTQGLQQVLGSTILIGLMSALQLPIILTKLTYLIDNPWTVSLARAELAGLILADSLIDRNLGTRPITLVGFSLGSRMIFSCLRELVKKGAYGLIQNVYLFGSPVVANHEEYLRAKSIVTGRFVNAYATNDWILGYLFRATSGGIRRVAGLGPIEVEGIENRDVTEWVQGHMAYRAAMPRLLREMGWQVESDEFTEIEDPDPDNHEKRQRELINEIEGARKDIDAGKKSRWRFGMFKRGKLAEKKEWETYDERLRDDMDAKKAEEIVDKEGGVLFDLDAIRAEVAELAAQGIEIKQLESTMPPMKVDLALSEGSSPYQAPARATKSFDDRLAPESAGAVGLGVSASSPSFHAGRVSSESAHDRNGHRESEDDNVSMTFDTSFHSSPAPSCQRSPVPSLPKSPSQLSNLSGSDKADRPTLRPYQSSPAGVASPDYNAWADDDEFKSEEGEVSMTFE